MTNKKLITVTAKKIRKTLPDLDLPLSIKLAKLYVKRDPKFLDVLSDLGFAYSLDIDADPYLGGVDTGTVTVTTPKCKTSSLKYYDGVIID
ncbi:hypothetical protein [Brevibacillus sp. MCWH]|uniref:hypothetical protein n=1 Tax=Brevibacillus sp. MCWH TaxID=2508871 RepID=UPI0014922EA7|nr:hypothetical protein [Brevibacillus sp. MCWH]NNV04725.1 hypothetical protein [Brevibacillus sp. MCWH]